MAVRFGASGQHYTRSLSLGTTTAFTVTMWARKVGAGTGTADLTLWSLGNGTTDFIATKLRGDVNSFRLHWQVAGNANTFSWSKSYSLQTWMFVGMTFGPPTDMRIVAREITAPDFEDGSFPYDAISVPGSSLLLGQSHLGGEWLNGSICGVKVWTAALTPEEIRNESWSYLPQRTTNLRAWYPLTQAETPDFSGNGATLTGGTGAVTEDGPGISWGGPGIVSPVRVPQVVVPAGRVAEADTAQTVQATKRQSFGQAVDADAALQVTAYKARPISQAIELDAGQPIIFRPTVDPAAETQAARPFARSKARVLGQAVEVGSAAAVTLIRSRAAFTAVDAQASQPVISAKRKLAGQAAETSQARPTATAKARPAGVAAETNVSQIIRRPLLVWRIAETDSAQPIRPARVRDLGPASEVTQARLVVGARGGRVGQAVEFNTVRPAEQTKQQLISQAAETETALLVRRSGARFRVVRTYRRWSAGSPYRKYSR